MIKQAVHPDDLLVKLTLIFPATVLLQGIQAFSWINKCMVAVMLLLMAWQIKKDRSVLIAGILCGVLSVAALLLSNRLYLRVQDAFYFPLYVLYCLYWVERSELFGDVLRKNLTFGAVSILLWGLLVGISVFVPSSYYHEEMNTVFFQSFSNTPFRLGSSCVIVLLMIHFLAYYKNRMFFLANAVPMVVIFATGARIYLLVGVGILFLSLYLLCSRKWVFWASLIPLTAALVFAVLNSSIADKFVLVARSQETLYGNYLDAFTSGRTVFWKLDLNAFLALPALQQLIGNGLSFAYEITATQYVRSIWAHNDFIFILMSYGWIGLALYFYCFVRLVGKFRKTYSLGGIPLLGAIAFCMGNACINGMYFYSAIMLAMPFMFYAMSLNKSKQNGVRK